MYLITNCWYLDNYKGLCNFEGYDDNDYRDDEEDDVEDDDDGDKCHDSYDDMNDDDNVDDGNSFFFLEFKYSTRVVCTYFISFVGIYEVRWISGLFK